MPGGPKILISALAACLFSSLSWIPGAAPAPGGSRQETQDLAVIVHPKNPATNLDLDALRTYFKLERQFWPDKKRVKLFLRPSRSLEMQILEDVVYRMSSSELRKYWIGKVFRGEIPAKPAIVPTASAAGARVRDVPEAFTVVLANEVPEGVRVLTIDGKKPGDAGYPLRQVSASAGRLAP